ncbi:MAG: GDP-mannose 4,6-dehydratase [Candidatus Hydrogenedentes bacterium]|nr:GDP-mannose 4,6-dehydratase [Candidatus Hydrogenedentota bacterium]
MSKRALITGANGFAGRALCAWLEERGWDVAATVYPPVDGALTCDVRDEASIAAALKAAGKITHIFHLAAIAFVPDATKAPLNTMDVNLQGTIRLCQMMELICPEARLVHIGSADAYGPPEYLPMDEAHPLRPQNAYAVSKAAADQYLDHHGKTSGLNIVRVRPFNHSGPGQSTSYVLPSLAQQVARAASGIAEPVIHVGNLEATRDFLHVHDVVRAYERIARDGHPGDVFNVCSGTAHSIQSVLDAFLSFAGVKIAVEQDPDRMRPSEVPAVLGSHKKLTECTGWEPEIPFETLLRKIYDHHAAQLQQEAAR